MTDEPIVFFEGTLGEDGEPLAALVLVSEQTSPGCRIRVRHIRGEVAAARELAPA